MMGLALKFFIDNWKSIVFGVIVLAVLSYVGVLKLELGSARGKVADLTGQVKSLKSDNTELNFAYLTLAKKMLEQNRAINDLKSESDMRIAKSLAALTEARKKTLASESQVKWLQEQLTKPNTDKTCNDALTDWRKTK